MTRFKDIRFSGLKRFASKHNTVVMVSTRLQYTIEEMDDITRFFRENNFIPEDKKVIDCRKIIGNIKGDNGRVDNLIVIEDCPLHPIARLRMGGWIKWTDDFIYNYSKDFNK